jgi:ElaB/YqjD/DUF883 family membrane-anchored ribosome-binding protein
VAGVHRRPQLQELSVSVQPDIAAARDDVQRARDQLSDTISEIEARVTAPVRAVKDRLDVGRVIRDHPWAALATAVGVGAAVAVSGADRRAASLAGDAARKGVEKVREGGVAGVRMAREAPSKTRGALSAMVDALGAKVAISVIDALRGSGSATTRDAQGSGLGFVDHDAPGHESDTEAASPT